MTATAHALVGGAIAASIPDPLIGLPLAFISHPFIDMIPHWDFGWGWREKTKLKLFIEGSLDLALGTLVAFLIFGRFADPAYFFAAVLLSESWDLLETPYWFLKWNFPPFSTMYKFQSKIQGKAALPWGIVTQVATVLVITALLNTF